jgi:hypothetical protein
VSSRAHSLFTGAVTVSPAGSTLEGGWLPKREAQGEHRLNHWKSAPNRLEPGLQEEFEHRRTLPSK